MIVCLCRAVSDHAIRAASVAGQALEELVQATGAGSDCGDCSETVKRIAREARPCRSEPCAGCPNHVPSSDRLSPHAERAGGGEPTPHHAVHIPIPTGVSA
jgi:bacterioferritin-associated ferredoxin